MSIFLYILSHSILPIFLLILLGFVLGKKFALDIFSLSKLIFYLFSPAFIFVNLYSTPLQLDMLYVFICALLLLFSNDLIGRLIARLRGYDPGLTNAFRNSVMFNNSGNIGVSLITLVFTSAPFVIDGKTPYLQTAITAQIIIMVLQSISVNTLGFYNAGRAKLDARHALLQVLTMPSIYAIPGALILKQTWPDLPEFPLWPALQYLKNGMVPMTLLTLGVQLSQTRFDFHNVEVYLSASAKLLIGPLLAMLFIHLFGFTGAVAQTILIAHSVPTAVNTALIAVECDSCQDFASQAVMLSTLCSAATLTFAIYAARALYPV